MLLAKHFNTVILNPAKEDLGELRGATGLSAGRTEANGVMRGWDPR